MNKECFFWEWYENEIKDDGKIWNSYKKLYFNQDKEVPSELLLLSSKSIYLSQVW